MTPRALEDCSRFVITGCQRSGTTMLGMVFEAHPGVELVDENDESFHPHGEITRELDLDAVRRLDPGPERRMGFKAPRDSHRLDELFAAFPDLRVVWLQRDVRQVVSSMLELQDQGKSWATVFAPREIRKHLQGWSDPTARAIYRNAKRRDPPLQPVALATLCWLVKRRQGAEATALFGDRIRHVEYDTLVSEPAVTLRQLLDFIGLDWSEQILDHPAVIAPAGAVDRPGGADPTRPIDQQSRSKWRQLPAEALALIEEIEAAYSAAERVDR